MRQYRSAVSTKVFSDDLELEYVSSAGTHNQNRRREISLPLMLNLSKNYPIPTNVLANLVGPVGIPELKRLDQNGTLRVTLQWRGDNMDPGTKGNNDSGVGLVKYEVASREEHLSGGGDGRWCEMHCRRCLQGKSVEQNSKLVVMCEREV